MKQLLTDDQKKRMWRNAAIRKEFKTLNDGTNAITAIHKYLAEKYTKSNGEQLTNTMIRLIIAEKEAK